MLMIGTNKSIFNERIMGKKQILFLIEDEENGEKFGYYLDTIITEEYNNWIRTYNKTFEFTLDSNGRLENQ